MQELQEGVRLKQIVWSDDVFINEENTDSGIFVSMQYGQMSLVPWAAYSFRGEKILTNLANVESVTVK